jgi:hypothetical protein
MKRGAVGLVRSGHSGSNDRSTDSHAGDAVKRTMLDRHAEQLGAVHGTLLLRDTADGDRDRDQCE